MAKVKSEFRGALSDHTKQTAEITLKNDSKLKIITHNMLEQCSTRKTHGGDTRSNNAWKVTETTAEYHARLDKLAEGYKKDIKNGADIIALQECPKDNDLIYFIQKMELDNQEWNTNLQSNGRKQPMVMFSKVKTVGKPLKKTASPGLGKAAQTVRFNVNGEKIDLINIHAKYGDGTTSAQMDQLMTEEDGVTKVRFGDHNGNADKFSDLLTYPEKYSTSIAHAGRKPGFVIKRKNYDGFALSNESVQIKTFPSETFIIKSDENNQQFSVLVSAKKDAAEPQRANPAPAAEPQRANPAPAAAPHKLAQDQIFIPQDHIFTPQDHIFTPTVEKDPITQAIRDNIIALQMKMFQDKVATLDAGNNPHIKIKGASPQGFKDLLKTPEVKQLLDAALEDKEFIKEVNAVEVSGYKKVHEQFKDNFETMNWGNQPEKTKERLQKVSNKDNETICTLTEKTIDVQTSIKLEDGSTKNISSYRTINFQTSLDQGASGPMHVSLAVKDSKGQNIAESKAVYFTAHYNKAGKLTEVSSPQPVKFSGQGDDAIGYIERDGEVYTLPVTKGTYQKMMKAVEANKGASVDLSQKTPLAQDFIAKAQAQQIRKRLTVSTPNAQNKVPTTPRHRTKSGYRSI